MALLTGLRVIPMLLLGLFAGQLVDRVSRRVVMLLADIGRAAALLCIPVAFLLHYATAGVSVVMAVTSALDVFFDVAYPRLSAHRRRPRATGGGQHEAEASGAISEVAGFSLAGVITRAVGAPLAAGGRGDVHRLGGLLAAHSPPRATHRGQQAESASVARSGGLRAVVGHPCGAGWRATRACADGELHGQRGVLHLRRA